MSLSISRDELTAPQRVGDTAAAPRKHSLPSWISRAVYTVGIALAAVLFFAGGWERRWIADDGLIVLRTVRNLMAGNGPVFNMGERVETNTSAAWSYIVYAVSWVTQARLEYIVLALALALSVGAIVFAMLGAGRLWGGTAAGLLLPAGALVYIAVPPARDYATSGLESALVIFWLGLLWWLLVRWATAERVRAAGLLTTGFVAGMGPLVRPELVTVGALALMLIFFAPTPRPLTLRPLLVFVSGAVPVGYQIWRMGYYGLPYPNTAVAKDAAGSKWGQGFTYLGNLIDPYFLWVPLLALAIAGVVLGRTRSSGVNGSVHSAGAEPAERPTGTAGAEPAERPTDTAGAEPAERPTATARTESSVRVRRVQSDSRLRRWQAALRRPRVVVALFVLAALILLVYSLRVGGDFMHGRMLLPVLFCLLLPVAVIPIRLRREKAWAPAVALIAWLLVIGWAVIAANTTGMATGTTIGRDGIVDERAYYVLNTGHDHPIRAEDYLDYPRMRAMLEAIDRTPDGGLVLGTSSYMRWDVVPPPLPIPPGGVGHTVYFLNLGMTSMNVPLDVRVWDQMGLAYPLAAHSDRLTDGRIGHDKALFPDWVVADLRMVDKHPWLPWYLDEDWVAQAKVALTCPATQELLTSTRSQLTWERWKQNFTRSFEFASYRFDRVPKYAIELCDLEQPVTSQGR